MNRTTLPFPPFSLLPCFLPPAAKRPQIQLGVCYVDFVGIQFSPEASL